MFAKGGTDLVSGKLLRVMCRLIRRQEIEMAGHKQTSEEFPAEVEIFENVNDSRYIRPMRMKFKRVRKPIVRDGENG